MITSHQEFPRVQVELPAFDDLRAAVTIPEDVVAAYWSGSIVAGWTHALSDLDAYVVCKEAPDVVPQEVHLAVADPPQVPVLVGEIGEWRLDAELWMEAQVDQMIARVPLWRSDRSDRHMARIEEREFLTRLVIAHPMHGSDWVEDRRRELERLDFTRILAARSVDEADSLLEDAGGLVRTGDMATAALATREAFGLVADALAIQEGQLSPTPKWRARRMAEARPAALPWDRYWSIDTMRTFDPEDPEPWIRETVELCQDLILEVELPE